MFVPAEFKLIVFSIIVLLNIIINSINGHHSDCPIATQLHTSTGYTNQLMEKRRSKWYVLGLGFPSRNPQILIHFKFSRFQYDFFHSTSWSWFTLKCVLTINANEDCCWTHSTHCKINLVWHCMPNDLLSFTSSKLSHLFLIFHLFHRIEIIYLLLVDFFKWIYYFVPNSIF